MSSFKSSDDINENENTAVLDIESSSVTPKNKCHVLTRGYPEVVDKLNIFLFIIHSVGAEVYSD